MACFVSLCLELVLGDFVPTTVSEGWLGLCQDDFKFVVYGPTLEQIQGISMLRTVGVGWVGQNRFKFVVNSPTLGHILGSSLLKTVGVGWVGQIRGRL